MNKQLYPTFSITGLLAVILILSGCAMSGKIKYMQEVENSTLRPEPGKALILFIRPKDLMHAFQASVLRATPDDPDLIGVLASNSRVGYQAAPGKHVFLTAGFISGSEFL
jgi:hypothetical protein